MPFLLYGAGDLLYALLAVLCSVAGALIGNMLSDLLPTIVGKVVGPWVSAIWDHIESWFVSNTKSAWVRVANFVHGIPWLLNALAVDTGLVLVHLGDLIAHLNNTTIPQAASTAQSNSYAHADSLATSLQNNISASETAAFDHADSLASSLQDNINTVIDVTIPAAEAAAEQNAHDALATVEAALSSQLQGIQGEVNSLTTLATVTLPAEINSAVQASYSQEQANLVSAVQTLQGELTALQDEINSANSAIASNLSLIQTAEGNISKLQGEETIDQAAIDQNEQAIDSANTAISAANDQITQAKANIDSLSSQLDTLQGTQTIQGDNIGALQQVTSVAIPAAIAGVAAGVAAITTEFDECAVTTCDGPNNIGSVLEGLLGGLITIGEFGFIAEAIKNPTPTADALSPLFETIDNGATDLWNTILELV